MMMKRIGAWMLLALLTLVGEWAGRCYGCLEEERVGLLEIQSLIDPDGIYLMDWVDDNSNCCEWSRIECDNTTRRVIQLFLSGARDDISLGDWVLNASLFQSFKELRSLELAFTGLVGCMENEGFEVLSSKLRELGLSFNRFNNDKSILSCFNGNLSTLKSLDLSWNWLTAGSGGSFYGFKVLSSRLKRLENLDLSWNHCNDSIFPSLTGFSSLKSLDLSGNHLKGSINSFQLQPIRLGKLENLDLSANGLNNSILSILSGLSSLKSLDLSDNQLTGSGFEIISSHLGKLENLDLTDNIFNENIFSHLLGLSSLKSLNLSSNMLRGSTTFNGLRMLEFLQSLPISLKTLSLKDTNLSQGTFFNSSTLEELHLDRTSLPIKYSFNTILTVSR